MGVYLLQRTTDHYEDQQIEILGLFDTHVLAMKGMQRDLDENPQYKLKDTHAENPTDYEQRSGVVDIVAYDFDYYSQKTDYTSKDYGVYRLINYRVQTDDLSDNPH